MEAGGKGEQQAGSSAWGRKRGWEQCMAARYHYPVTLQAHALHSLDAAIVQRGCSVEAVWNLPHRSPSA